jgi:hypothetical protein
MLIRNQVWFGPEPVLTAFVRFRFDMLELSLVSSNIAFADVYAHVQYI